MLRIEQLGKSYGGGPPVLQDVDLEIGEGMFGLLGPNGAGKTTLMRIVAGLLEPSRGRVVLDGVDLTAHPERGYPQLGYLPQDFGFYPNLMGFQMLEHLLRLKGIGPSGSLRQITAKLLDRVGLSTAARKKTRAYSSGMRQRLGIAQALAGDPRLILVDEPTAGLDPEERQRFYRLLAEMAGSRVVLLSTHIVEDVAVLCSRFAILRGGRIFRETTPAEAVAALRGQVGEHVVPREEFATLEKSFHVTRMTPFEGRCRVRIHAPDAALPEGFRPVEPLLEDAYLVAMGGCRPLPGP